MKIIKVNGYGLEYSNLVIGNKIILTKTLGSSKFFIEGLGLTKAEREIFGVKRFNISNIISVFIGKLAITYNKKGYKDQFKNMNSI